MLHYYASSMKQISTIAILLYVLINLPGNVVGQDPHYSQYYAAPLYLNPAFTGTIEEHRFVANYRNQWPAIPNAFETYSFSYDYNLSSLRSGLGIIFSTDRAGSAGLRSSNLGLLYSYKVQMNDWVLTPAIEFSYGVRDMDFNKLVFGDQININGPTQDNAMNRINSVSYFDFNTGILLYNRKFWAGYAIHHLNEPNKSLLNEIDKIPMKQSFHAGMKINLYNGPFKKDRYSSIAPSFVYNMQGAFDQLDFGLHYIYDPVFFGLWYRGIPIQQNVKDNMNHDAFSFIAGLTYDTFEIGYSYDFTISALGPASGGAHEVSVKLELVSGASLKKPKPAKFTPCPAFYNKSRLLK